MTLDYDAWKANRGSGMMTSATVRVRAYAYEELPDSVKDRLIIEKAEDESEFSYECLLDDTAEELQNVIPGFKRSDLMYSFGGRDAHVKVSSRLIPFTDEDPDAPEYVGYGYTAHLGGGIMRAGGTDPDDHLNDEDTVTVQLITSICEDAFRRGLDILNYYPSEDDMKEAYEGVLFDERGYIIEDTPTL